MHSGHHVAKISNKSVATFETHQLDQCLKWTRSVPTFLSQLLTVRTYCVAACKDLTHNGDRRAAEVVRGQPHAAGPIHRPTSSRCSKTDQADRLLRTCSHHIVGLSCMTRLASKAQRGSSSCSLHTPACAKLGEISLESSTPGGFSTHLNNDIFNSSIVDDIDDQLFISHDCTRQKSGMVQWYNLHDLVVSVYVQPPNNNASIITRCERSSNRHQCFSIHWKYLAFKENKTATLLGG